MLARRSLSRMYLPLPRSRRSLAIAVICLSLIALLDPLITSRPARADMRRRVRADLHRVHRVSKELVRIRKLAEGLKAEERALNTAIDWSQSTVRGVESDSMVRLWMRMASLRYRMWVVRRAAARLRRVRHELEDRIHSLRIALTHLFRVCPVDEPRSYVDDFGVWVRRDEKGTPTKDKEKWHHHQGIDIFSVPGTPVRAPFPGWARVATNPVGGLAVKVFGAQGFVYNAHLLTYGHLGHVEEGTIIGYVGNTGDARATSAHDHFEWHPFNGPAVDAYPYLNEACGPRGLDW
jgi:hypothetical protein